MFVFLPLYFILPSDEAERSWQLVEINLLWQSIYPLSFLSLILLIIRDITHYKRFYICILI